MTEERNGRRPHGEILLSESQIADRVRELGAEITADYTERAPLFVGVLKGAFVFMAGLVRAVDLDSGQFTDSVDLENYDQRKASKDPALSEELSASEDLAKISRRAMLLPSTSSKILVASRR